MDKDKLIAKLMAAFLGELDDRMRAWSRDLLAVEKATGRERDELLQALFRTAHSLKGSAHSVNAPLIERVCHALEDILAKARDEGQPFERDLIELLLTAGDAIADAGKRLREKQSLADGPLSGVARQLSAYVAGRQPHEIGRPGVATAQPTTVPDTEAARAPTTDTGTAPAPTTDPSAVRTPHADTTTVRVPVAKLDVLLNQSGEVVLGHGQSSARLDELSATTKQFDRWRADFSRVAAAVRRHLRQRERAGPSDAPGNGPLVSATLLDPLARLSEQLDRLQRRLDGAAGGLAQQLRSVEQAAEQLDEEVRQLRMLPVAEAFHGLERTVRDLAAAANKAIDLVIQGGEVALDRTVIELLKTPLLHLVRNAVDHGIESQAERVSSGKPSRGRIVVAAVLRGDRVSVRVQDDGRGLDLEALREQVRRRGLPEPYDDAELARLIFLPGVSTARLVTDVSGRGVGLDVVRSQVEALRGTIDVTFEPGRGAGFTLTVPLTLTTMRVLMVQSAGQIFGLPVVQIERLLRVGIDEVASVGGRSVVMLNGSALPLVSLAKILGLGEGEQPLSRKVPAVVLIAAGQRIGLAVQALLEEREVLVKSLGSRIKRLRHFSGTTIRPDGRVALLLSAMALVETALAQPAGGAVLPTPSPAAVRKRLLVADDSITTRTLIKTILEASGYEVAAAADGAEAWQLLQDKNFDLVVSDVDMPRMDGFALTETIRGSKRFRTLPVILVTALESDADKVRGMQAGADAYLKKSAFDQRNLLETIRRLL